MRVEYEFCGAVLKIDWNLLILALRDLVGENLMWVKEACVGSHSGEHDFLPLDKLTDTYCFTCEVHIMCFLKNSKNCSVSTM